jgi:hypothetical protein
LQKFQMRNRAFQSGDRMKSQAPINLLKTLAVYWLVASCFSPNSVGQTFKKDPGQVADREKEFREAISKNPGLLAVPGGQTNEPTINPSNIAPALLRRTKGTGLEVVNWFVREEHDRGANAFGIYGVFDSKSLYRELARVPRDYVGFKAQFDNTNDLGHLLHVVTEFCIKAEKLTIRSNELGEGFATYYKRINSDTSSAYGYLVIDAKKTPLLLPPYFTGSDLFGTGSSYNKDLDFVAMLEKDHDYYKNFREYEMHQVGLSLYDARIVERLIKGFFVSEQHKEKAQLAEEEERKRQKLLDQTEDEKVAQSLREYQQKASQTKRKLDELLEK